MEYKFRDLKADEIDVRVSQIGDGWLSLLLYKDARVDMDILDETVGPMNWQRKHTRDNANCIISIWDDVKKQWIEKEDTGTESFSEKEKGLASDSFKRAGFNWGIGRELYSAPFIFIGKENAQIIEKRDKLTCYDKFKVTDIAYDDEGNINGLVIYNTSQKKFVYKFGSVSQEVASDKQLEVIKAEMLRTGIKEKSICIKYNKNQLVELTKNEAVEVITKLKGYKDASKNTVQGN